MQLVEFEVNNYRSIDKKTKISLASYAVLVGANNEGKSNVVRALHCAIGMLKEYARSGEKGSNSGRGRYTYSRLYEVDDFPKSKGENSEAIPRFLLHFELTDDECEEFAERFGPTINKDLAIEIKVKLAQRVHHVERVDFDFKKRGPSKAPIQKILPQVAQYIGERFHMVVSEAVRPGEEGQRLLERLVESRIRNETLHDQEYREAVELISGRRDSIVAEVEKDFGKTLSRFLREYKGVNIKSHNMIRSQVRDFEVILDDGVATKLSSKGDGVQSLFSLAAMQHRGVAEKKLGQDLLSVIEEPEAHLNSGSMYTFRDVLEEMADVQQLLVVTHSAIFVDKFNVGSNILVCANRARNCTAVSEIREALGIQNADSLDASEIVLLVEGVTDRRFFEKYIDLAFGTTLARAISQGRFIIKETGGTPFIENHLRQCDNTVTQAFLVVDKDSAGHEKVKKLLDEGMIENSEYTTVLNPSGSKYSATIEDCYTPDVLAAAFTATFGPKIAFSSWGKSSKKACLERVEELCAEYGKYFDGKQRRLFKENVSMTQISKQDINEKALRGVNELLTDIEERLGY